MVGPPSTKTLTSLYKVAMNRGNDAVTTIDGVDVEV